MSSKYKLPKPPRDPATLKVTRGDVIAFSQFLSGNPDFCLRVLLTAQKAIHDENVAQGEAVSVPENTGLGSDAEVATQTPAEPVRVNGRTFEQEVAYRADPHSDWQPEPL